jgi:hypothetical protein
MSSESLQIKPTPRDAMRIAVVGAGFAGIGMGIQLKAAGYRNFTLGVPAMLPLTYTRSHSKRILIGQTYFPSLRIFYNT